MNFFIIYLFFDLQKSINHIQAQLQNILLIHPVRSYLFAKYYWMKRKCVISYFDCPKVYFPYYLNLDTNFAWHCTISIASGTPFLEEFHEPIFWFDEVIHIGLYLMPPPIHCHPIPSSMKYH